MGKTPKKWINLKEFEELEADDRLQCKFMNGIAIVLESPSDNEVRVIFEGGCWDKRELNLIRQQIYKVL